LFSKGLFILKLAMFTAYILFSKTIQRYYVGYTNLPLEERLRYHLTNHKGFTARAKDWVIVFSESKSIKSKASQLKESKNYIPMNFSGKFSLLLMPYKERLKYLIIKYLSNKKRC
jgi:putative endonuclease